jgi:hypothetical protein
MSNRQIKIRYSDDEAGPAELLGGGKLARILDFPLLNDELWKDDIVKLTQEEYPSVEEIVFQGFPCRSHVRYQGKDAEGILMSIFRLLFCECFPIWPVSEEKPDGVLAVAHDDGTDPVALAEAIGIPQDEPSQDTPMDVLEARVKAFQQS